MVTNMEKVVEQIKKYTDEIPNYKPLDEDEMPHFPTIMKMGTEECEIGQIESINRTIERVRKVLLVSIETAQKTKKGSKEAAMAWDIVEELEAEISHLKSRC